jgi:hypothetical protein
VGCNTHVHESITRNLSVYLPFSQSSKNAMSFLLSLRLLFNKIRNKREEQVLAGHRAWRAGVEGGGGPNNV